MDPPVDYSASPAQRWVMLLGPHAWYLFDSAHADQPSVLIRRPAPLFWDPVWTGPSTCAFPAAPEPQESPYRDPVWWFYSIQRRTWRRGPRLQHFDFRWRFGYGLKALSEQIRRFGPLRQFIPESMARMLEPDGYGGYQAILLPGGKLLAVISMDIDTRRYACHLYDTHGRDLQHVLIPRWSGDDKIGGRLSASDHWVLFTRYTYCPEKGRGSRYDRSRFRAQIVQWNLDTRSLKVMGDGDSPALLSANGTSADISARTVKSNFD